MGDCVALHLTVHGRVQGVGFREGMVRAATLIGVSGWVRNRSEGTVEAVVWGASDDCARLTEWARRGPPAAQVTRVETRPASAAESALVGADGFRRLASF